MRNIYCAYIQRLVGHISWPSHEVGNNAPKPMNQCLCLCLVKIQDFYLFNLEVFELREFLFMS